MSKYGARLLVGQPVGQWTKAEPKMITKVNRFTASGTWTVPDGVTYAVAHIRAGGGGTGSAAAGAGGNSSVAFAGGTVTATGGNPINSTFINESQGTSAGQANSGNGAKVIGNLAAGGGSHAVSPSAQDGAYIVAGDAVTPAESITVTVGAGGVAGSGGAAAAGGSGYVWIEYQVKK